MYCEVGAARFKKFDCKIDQVENNESNLDSLNSIFILKEWETAFNIIIRIEEALFMMGQWGLVDVSV